MYSGCWNFQHPLEGTLNEVHIDKLESQAVNGTIGEQNLTS